MFFLSDYWSTLQASLIPFMEQVVETRLTEKEKRLVAIMDVIGVEKHLDHPCHYGRGRKPCDIRSIARAFIARAALNLSQTKMLREMLLGGAALRAICGCDSRERVPGESVFSRSFAVLARNGFGDKTHEALVRTHVGESVVMHVSRDSTEIAAREKPATKRDAKRKAVSKRRRGRPRKGEETSPCEPSRLVRQMDQTPEESLAELSYACDVGTKLNSKGHMHWWIGYKLHIDWADNNIPLTAVTTSASVHDSQLAIPMARMTVRKVTSFYDLMDAAYDAEPIRRVCEKMGHVTIMDTNNRNRKNVPAMDPHGTERYKERTTAERGNSRLKDGFGLRDIRYRTHMKVHLCAMFAVIVLFADQLIRVFSG